MNGLYEHLDGPEPVARVPQVLGHGVRHCTVESSPVGGENGGGHNVSLHEVATLRRAKRNQASCDSWWSQDMEDGQPVFMKRAQTGSSYRLRQAKTS